jgi:lipopolysaccharide transport system ATP-binding protein
MSHPAIRVEGLSKSYRIGELASRYDYTTFREAVGRAVTAPFRRRRAKGSEEDTTVWALKDVSFDVQPGEVVGIIGRNGAGKSTLLKILSKITKPTSGRVEIRGRVASLLEVGTGFHPELTGRENIYLNGAILGMMRREIDRKFDEIVAFAEVEKFIDTPVKRYSSGMYLRLAFAVAAHLEPEILIVDEVLAVGDASFQKKCLGKMGEVAKQGRTVLFVSHNLAAVQRLCAHGLLLSSGRLTVSDDISRVVQSYTAKQQAANQVADLSKLPRSPGIPARARFSSASVAESHNRWQVGYGHLPILDLSIRAEAAVEGAELGISLLTSDGYEFASSLSSHDAAEMTIPAGEVTVRAHFPDIRLKPGHYRFSLGLRSARGFEDHLPDAFGIDVVANATSALHKTDTLLGIVIPTVDFSIVGAQSVSPPYRNTSHARHTEAFPSELRC